MAAGRTVMVNTSFCTCGQNWDNSCILMFSWRKYVLNHWLSHEHLEIWFHQCDQHLVCSASFFSFRLVLCWYVLDNSGHLRLVSLVRMTISFCFILKDGNFFLVPELGGTSLPWLCENTVAIREPCGAVDEFDGLMEDKFYILQYWVKSSTDLFLHSCTFSHFWFMQRNINLKYVSQYLT